MYRLLAVDDEPYIVDWICEIAEVELGIELEIYRAYSVQEALNWLNRARIDIMITDIKMPDESGISLVQKVTRNWPKCKIIMLTAYAEFDYAYAAVESNVIAYILKTEDDTRILEAIRKAVRELDKELKDLHLPSNTNDTLPNYLLPIQNDIAIRILKGVITQKEEIISQLESVGIHIDAEAPFILVMSKIDGIPEKANKIARYNYRYTIKKIIEHYFTQYFHCSQIEYSDVIMVSLLQPKKGQNDEGDLSKDTSLKADEYYITYTKETLELVLQSCKENTGLDLSFIVSNTLLEVTQLRNEYQHMKKILLYCMPDGKGVIIGDTHLNEQKGISHLSLNLVQFINQYVQTHIAEDVSLIKLSEVTGYNPSYLSRLYKEVANENLSAYINRVRFDKAKNLLINSDLNLNEIAAEVGLNSRTYFNRFIKNITGMSPQEYRTHLS
ncbi:MAG TPA: hypothetical protein DIW17_09835 [Clostridiales bacterium]|nr:response regulator [Clostridia bacterium]HCS74162.1 hypothetical protein [Clostridiales bacterium]